MPASDPLRSPWGCPGAAGGRAGSDWRSRITPWPALLQAWRGRQRGGRTGRRREKWFENMPLPPARAEPPPRGISLCPPRREHGLRWKVPLLLLVFPPVRGEPPGSLWGAHLRVRGHSWVTVVAASLGAAVCSDGDAAQMGVTLWGLLGAPRCVGVCQWGCPQRPRVQGRPPGSGLVNPLCAAAHLGVSGAAHGTRGGGVWCTLDVSPPCPSPSSSALDTGAFLGLSRFWCLVCHE